MINKLKFSFPAKSMNEALSRNIVATFCLSLNPTMSELSDIKTAVSEAVTNCIVHAYGDSGSGEIEISAIIHDNGVLGIEIKDYGVGISDVDQATQPFFTTKGDAERSGMGFTVMQTFMDTLDVVSVEGEGTTIHMSKKFKHGGENA